MPVCRFFSRKGGCERGDQCYFQHVQLSNPESLHFVSRLPNLKQSKLSAGSAGSTEHLAEVSCRYFNLGMCKYGDMCRFRHNTPSEGEVMHEPITPQAKNDTFSNQSPANTNKTYQRRNLRRLRSQMLEIWVKPPSGSILTAMFSASNLLPPRLLVYKCAMSVAHGTNPRKRQLSSSPLRSPWRKLLRS